MSKESFYCLHSLLHPQLEEYFFPERSRYPSFKQSPYYIKTDICLSIAIHYFAGASVYDLMVTHGVSSASVFLSIWGVIDCINSNDSLKMSFPGHREQEKLLVCFRV